MAQTPHAPHRPTPLRRPPLLFLLLAVILSGCATDGVTGSRGATPTALAARTSFRAESVITRLNKPTAVRFASDGRVFVAEKTGIIKSYRRWPTPSRRSWPICSPT